MRITLSIKQRLLGVGLLSLIFIGIVSAAGYWGVHGLTRGMADITLTASAQRNEMQADMMRIALHGDVLAALQAGANQKGADQKNIEQKNTDDSTKKSIIRDMEEHSTMLRESIAKNAALPLNQDIKDILTRTQPAIESYVDIARAIIQQAFEDNAAATARLPEYINNFKILAGTMLALGDLMDETMQESQKAGGAMGVVARNAITATLTAALVVLTVLLFFLVRSITRPLARAIQLANIVAAGDLTSKIEVKSSDETGKLMQALKDMNDSLLEIVGNVRTSVDSITTSAKEIATGNSDLSQRTEEQAASLQETASSMEELSSTVKHNAENAKQANQLGMGARDVAMKGGAVVSRVVTTMASINESSKKIVDIISVIEGIAFQTNILALNAAVEAARAGEQGRGFAVVAGEVRTLAQRSAAAAKEIKALIGDSVDKVAGGTKLVDEAGKTMEEIVVAVKRVTDILAEISAASSEQSTGIDQVNKAIIQMDEVTQQNAALVEEDAAAAESMEEEAENLTEAVSVFKVGDGMLLAVPAQHNPASRHGRVASKSATQSFARQDMTALEKRQGNKQKVLLEKSGENERERESENEWKEF